MDSPINPRVLSLIEFNGEDPLTRTYHILEELNSRALEAVRKTNQKRSEFETGQQSKQAASGGQRQADFILATKRAAYVSAALNQWFLRKPMWDAIKNLHQAVLHFRVQYENGTHRQGWGWTVAAANNIACAEQLLKDSLKTLSRFSELSDDDGSFLSAVLSDCNESSWLNQMPLLPAPKREDNGFTMHDEAKLYLRCMEAITGTSHSQHVQYVAIVDVSDFSTVVVRKVAAYFETVNFNAEYSGSNELHLRKKLTS